VEDADEFDGMVIELGAELMAGGGGD